MPPRPLDSQINAWIFDLDNTLYHPRANLFAQIDARMTRFIQNLLGLEHDAARAIQKGYFRDHGTTLRGLMANHRVNPHDFLDYVHDIDMSVLPADPGLGAALAKLPGRRIVFTNGDGAYARRVLRQLDIEDAFDAVHCIVATDFVPKPEPSIYAGFVAAQRLDPARSLFVEDMARNLKPAKELGMTTVWVANGSEYGALSADDGHVDLVIEDVPSWLETVVAGLEESQA
jgi:putative hydrolase of the HAD superfamily